ncbi:MAG: HEAT repeat domain-containing protein, partial [Kiritimatiellaeota bacterium]|nr:HEAT repeat domain-containing protein [Kiritimatiellota bacterium]
LGVIGSLGVRHDEKAVSALAGLLKDPDAEVVQAAARALGMIGTAGAAKSLEGLLPGVSATNQLAFCEGLFRCAEALAAKGQEGKAIAIYDTLCNLKQVPHQVRTGAWRGAILLREKKGLPLLLQALRSPEPGLATAALRIAMEMKATGVSQALADELTKVPADRQIQLVNVLGQRGDAAALPALLGLSKAGDKAVRVAAIKAVTEIGHATAAAPLIELLKDPDGDVVQAATAGLVGLPGTAADEAITRLLATSAPALRLKMVELVRQRRIVTALPLLLKFMEDKDEALQAAVLKSYGDLSGAAEFPGLLAKLEKSSRAGEIGAMEKALALICGGAAKPEGCVPQLTTALARSVPGAKPAVLRILRAAGGAEALQAVRSAVDDANKDVHAAALRVLCEWKTDVESARLLGHGCTQGADVER